ncbi:molybdopterin-dependent oxidoreductase [Roseibium sp. FZY0029]|uniref:molybdopterin-dependent oxidoreductase n=1 Tax=Roseibium sp. FZY0029 TaxID=3116647 RepID=UPI002EC68B2C|nr:molybdopterin-dependent oxidoreductase [Roseibium sp. FZY0029]
MRTLLSFLAGALLLCEAAQAANLPAPSGDVILVVTGNIENTNKGDSAEFDMEMLESLDGLSKTLETPWTDGTTAFSGPKLRAVLEKVGARGSKLIVKALNDYSAEVPMEDAETYDTMLATKMNGEHMSVRNKGPVFLIYPFDTNPELFNEKYFSRSVWQIREVEVVE